ncbi:hypothetical protein BDB00DRAFT_813625 [Zychaea mexicana]|uniref:uncharacterized protein n=1 Tax=Zychaea mexicana TaxID=64656 RepID=UPI0022FE2DA2|nr:uncharacterized protein BDB00DRAFT_813625 [Zychaea mexicana]KAI9495509.1 hypothetical protein BDB00DRAFT_813625 [Zychaea mexicana]
MATTSAMPQLGRTPPTLSYFCVYNPSLAQSEENTKDQILYYTAKKVVPADVKMKQVGLAQALVNFSSAFSPSHSAQNVHSQKNRLVFLQPEPGFWLHMCIELSVLRKQVKDQKGKEKLVTEYLDSQLNDRAIESVLKLGYEQFKLLNGTMTSILDILDRRVLMHRIEEFFSEWIWQWDFDRLDRMVFSGVFNGVPTIRYNEDELEPMRKLDQALQDEYEVAHIMVLDEDQLVYRSDSLSMVDVRSLRKYVCQQMQQHQQDDILQQEQSAINTRKDKLSGFKSFTRTLSNTHILDYFSSTNTKDSSKPEDSSDTQEPTEQQQEEAAPDLEIRTEPIHGEFHEIVRVYLSSRSALAMEEQELLEEYLLIIYKHNESNLLWSFLIPSFADGADEFITSTTSLPELEGFLVKHELNTAVATVKENKETKQEKSLSLGKHFRSFFYDNATLNMRSTLLEQRKDSFTVSNDMLLQLLDLNSDFETFPNTSEVYTRSTANYWIAARRVYNKHGRKQQRQQPSTDPDSTSDHQEPPTEDEEDEIVTERRRSPDDYTEMYLIAAKKDTSLADVEETIRKMTASLVGLCV